MAELIDPQIIKNAWVNSEFVSVYLRKNSIQMHKGTHIGDIQNQHAPHGTTFIAEKVPGKQLNPFRGGALGKSDRDGILPQVQDISAFNGERIIPVVIERHFSRILSSDLILTRQCSTGSMPIAWAQSSILDSSAKDACGMP